MKWAAFGERAAHETWKENRLAYICTIYFSRYMRDAGLMAIQDLDITEAQT